MRSFMVRGKPVPDGRPKFARMGKGVRAYMPAKCTKYREQVKMAYQRVYPLSEMLEGALSMSIKVAIPRPKSHFGTGRNAGIIKKQFKKVHHTQKPDADNFAKMVLDALNKVAYLDDSQVIELKAVKLWTNNGENEGAIFVEISEISY